MAEPVVSFVVERLGDPLIQEALFLKGVEGQVETLKIELQLMQSFLKDADAKKEGDERVRTWVANIRDAAYDAEDVIDKFILKIASNRRGGLRNVLRRYACICIDLHMVGNEIEAIQTRIRNLSISRETYGIRNIGEGEGTSSANEMQRQLRRSYPHVVDQDIIGLEEDADRLVAELFKVEEQRRAVSIVGVGGLGKTTLAKKVYNHNDLQSHFDCCAWAFISQQCVRRDILLEILKKVSTPNKEELEKMEKMKDEELVENLYKFLEEKRYLVVLDDIWSTQTWDILNPAFPNGKKGSKLLLTTRNNEVALHVDPWSLHLEPQYLKEEERWALFCKKAFPKNNTGINPGLMEELGREMVRRCGGLPLAVAVLGGLLAKKSLNEWQIVQKNISSHLNKGELGVSEILSLSYNDLPYQLKPCFLYLGIFPEDFEIPTRKLIQLWVAEGFLHPEGEETMEDVGELYLVELINRSMVQIGRRNLMGRVKTCRVHDLMRDLCLLKAKEANFLEIFFHHGGNTTTIDSSYTRRHAIHSDSVRYVSLEHSCIPHLRTLVFFTPKSDSDISLKYIYQDFKLLRVLNLQNVQVAEGSLPKEIGKLLHLRYLGLRRTWIKELPPSIGNLRSLQTLDLRDCPSGLMIPNVIWMMKQLRHLHVDSDYSSDHLRLGTLSNLQTLTLIKGGSWIDDSLANLINLRKLGIYEISRSQVEVLLNSIFIKSNSLLQSLSLRMDGSRDETFPNLEPLSRSQHLLKLNLDGGIDTERLLQWPPNLTKLTLWRSKLQQDPMASLQNLPNLLFLRLLGDSYSGEEMICSAKGFPQLQVLELHRLDDLQEWRMEEGAMPCLRTLQISRCPQLRMVPEGLRFVTSLQELKIGGMPREFEDRVREEGGLGWYKVHILQLLHQFHLNLGILLMQIRIASF